METNYIQFNETLYPYHVHYKSMRSIRIKVIRGVMEVSAPHTTSIDEIERCLLQYQDRLLKQLIYFIPYYDYRDNGYVTIFGKQYTIVLRDVHEMKCAIHKQNLYVYDSRIDKCIEKFLKQVLLDYIEERVIGYLAHDFDLVMPRIEVKKYVGRWGSCFYKENRVTFNFSLVFLEKDLIDYVIVHELCHFLQANHSALFYQEVEIRIPDYKEKIKRLKEKSV